MNSDYTSLKARTQRFALDILTLSKELGSDSASKTICNQIVRCATSVGANYRSACRARSRADFISKITIVEEEADETLYWLELIEQSRILPEERLAVLKKEASELTAIFTQSGKTAKENK